jgi:hypothetical protein
VSGDGEKEDIIPLILKPDGMSPKPIGNEVAVSAPTGPCRQQRCQRLRLRLQRADVQIPPVQMTASQHVPPLLNARPIG